MLTNYLSDKERVKIIDFVETVAGKDSSGHDTLHCIRVEKLALKIAANELGEHQDVDARDIQLMALLHCVDDHKISLRTYHTMDNTRACLQLLNASREKVEELCNLIKHISWQSSKSEVTSDFRLKCIQDADRLDAIGPIGIARCFMFQGANGGSIDAAISHFDEKLLQVSAKLNTETAKNIAFSYNKYMQDYVVILKDQLSMEMAGEKL